MFSRMPITGFRLLTVCFAMLLGSQAFAHGMSEADKLQILDAGLIEFVWLGANHMLSGYDHLLFLLGVVFFLSRFSDIVKFITAFTLGHSITLVFATLYGIQANFYLVDAVIALTVCYKGFENLGGFQRLWGTKSPSLLWMVFGFGLIHGFGLSTRLQELPMGEGSIVMKILAFNAGVELGQIAALSIMLVVLAAWRRTSSFEPFNRIVNTALIALGGLLLVYQLHNYQHAVYAEDFLISRDDHSHAHEEMRAAKPSSLQFYQRRLQPQVDSASEIPSRHEHGDGQFHQH
jgi:hypothetical protein